MTSGDHALSHPRSGLSRAVIALLLAAAAAFFAYAVSSRWGDLHGGAIRFRPVFLALSALCICVAVAGFGLVWKQILDRLEGGERRPAYPLMRAFFVSWLARYIPGTVPFLLLRMEMTQRLGYRRSAVATSLVYENVLQLGTALAVSFVLLLAAMGQHFGSFALYGVALAPLAGAAVLAHPRLLVPAANRVARRLGRPEISADSVLPVRAIARAVALYSVFVVINGLGFYFALLAVMPAGPEHIVAAIGIYNLAGVIGVLAVFVPSGLGVREGIIVGLAGLQFPVEVAAAAALLARVAALAADGLPAAGVLLIDTARRLRG